GEPFCGACGRRLGDAAPDERVDDPADSTPGIEQEGQGEARPSLEGVFFPALCAFILAVALFEAAVLAANSGDVFGFLSDKYFAMSVLVPSPVRAFSLESGALQAYWVVVVCVILSCVAFATWGLAKSLWKRDGSPASAAVEGTALFWVSIFFCAYYFITIAFTLILSASGGDVTVPDFGDKVSQMFLMAEASVWEEVVTRLLLIGVPMAVISLAVTRKAESLKCLLGGFGMSTAAAVLIVLSAAVFGLAHYSGWDDQVWKVITTGVFGAALGYVFVRFGLYASILMHFIVNYISSFGWAGAGDIGDLVVMTSIGIGFVALCYIASKLWGSKESVNSLPLFRNGHVEE
ncbi:MAG: CPBP family intramembrane metalloprotease, partial [Methanomassiliicoccaceae archaeon]|nr:CPBP family intramembrane metalloprotease [Methanomassiliicoccaceae archaeon]